MDPPIVRNGPVKPCEIEKLRATVGWDRAEGTYAQVLQRQYANYTVRDKYGILIAYLSVLSDGVADAFLLDLMVHPNFQRRGIGSRLIRAAVEDIRQAGIRSVQVTFDSVLEPFYARCGFHIFKGGVIDFKTMTWDEMRR